MSAINGEYEQEQANAICYSQWREVHGGKEPEKKVEKAAVLNDGRKRFYAPIQKVEDQPDGTIRVYGIASTEDQDDQGEVILAEAMRKAIPDYMRFGAIREMHQLSAAGTALGCQVGEDGVTHLEGHIVDPVAVLKVKSKVYRGFSVGGKVTSRVAGDPKRIDGVNLEEISLVDRPANSSAILEMWKAGGQMADGGASGSGGALGTLADTEAGRKLAAAAAALAAAPMQVWACGDPAHQHAKKDEAAACMAKRAAAPAQPSTAAQAATAIEAGLAALTAAVVQKAGEGDKPYGDVEYADPGYQSDGKKRYPVDTEKHVRAAWSYINKPKNAGKYSADQLSHIKGKIRSAAKKFGVEISDEAGKAAAVFTKALTDAGRVASIIMELDWLSDALAMERAMEGDESENPGKLEQIVKDLCGFLNDLVAEETVEVIEGSETGHPSGLYGPFGWAAGNAAGAAAGTACDTIVNALHKANTFRGNLVVNQLEKARSAHHQHLLNLAYHATRAAQDVADGEEDKAHLGRAADALKEAGAGEYGPANIHATTDTGRNAATTAPATGGADPTGASAKAAERQAIENFAVLDMLKRAGDHKPLVAIAHDAVKTITSGQVCKASGAEMAHLHAAHFHMTKAGAVCEKAPPAGGLPDEHQGTKFTAASGGDLAKAAAERDAALADRDALLKALGGIPDALKALAADVTLIKNTPLPAAAIAVPAAAGLSKKQDNGGVESSNEALQAEIKKALEALPPEEKVIALIRVAQNGGRLPSF